MKARASSIEDTLTGRPAVREAAGQGHMDWFADPGQLIRDFHRCHPRHPARGYG